MTAPHPRLRLAAEDGRQVARTSKANRLAAKPGTDAARMARCLANIQADCARVLDAAMAAEAVANATRAACLEGDPIVLGALTREGTITAGYVRARISNLLSIIERAATVSSNPDTRTPEANIGP